MLYCATCRKGLPDGTIFCDYCGNEITDVSSIATTPTLPDMNSRPRKSSQANDSSRRRGRAAANAPVSKPTPATELPDDGESEQQTPPSLSAYTAQAPRPPEATPARPEPRKWEEPAPRDQRFTGTRLIQLQLGRDIFELSGQSTYLVGRRDVDQQLFPDVDLHDWDGADAGVSRRHLMIWVIGDVVSIEDLESRNSTILNGYRLFPHQQYPLVDGDEVRMGDITVLVRIIPCT